jgi:hypothetical protein
MKVTKEGEFSLELPDGTPVEVFARMVEGLMVPRLGVVQLGTSPLPIERQEPAEHAWMFTLLNSLMDELHIDASKPRTNADVAVEASRRLREVMGWVGRLREAIRVQRGTLYTPGIGGDIAALSFVEGLIRPLAPPATPKPRSRKRRP